MIQQSQFWACIQRKPVWKDVCSVMFVLVAQLCPTLCNPMNCSHGILCPWNSPGKSTGVVAIPFSRGSSQPRHWTHVFCISCIDRQILDHCCHLGSFVGKGMKMEGWHKMFNSIFKSLPLAKIQVLCQNKLDNTSSLAKAPSRPRKKIENVTLKRKVRNLPLPSCRRLLLRSNALRFWTFFSV